MKPDGTVLELDLTCRFKRSMSKKDRALFVQAVYSLVAVFNKSGEIAAFPIPAGWDEADYKAFVGKVHTLWQEATR